MEPGNLPVVWAEEERDESNDLTPLNNGAVPDVRVPPIKKPIQGPQPEEVPDNYRAEDDDEPLLSWTEMRFIEAEFALSQGNLQRPIEVVNGFRSSAGLPLISGAYEAELLVRPLQLFEGGAVSLPATSR